MENIINFTKIGVVKCDEFEVTFNDFIKKMSYLIMNDCDAYNVFYNDKEDKYFITYNSNRYVVKYGGEYLSKSTSDEVVEYLEQLVTMSKVQGKLHDTVETKKREIEVAKNKAMENAINGILKTNDDKEAKIELLNKKFDEEYGHPFKAAWGCFKGMIYGKITEATAVPTMLLGIVGFGALIVGGVLSLFGVSIPLWVFIASGVSVADVIAMATASDKDMTQGYKGLISLSLALILLPFLISIGVVGKLVAKPIFNRKINKIRSTFNTLDDNTKSKMKDMSKEAIELFLKDTKSDSDDKFRTLLKEFDELKNSILLIENESTKKEYASKLYEIIEYSVKATNVSLEDKDKVYSVLLDKTSELKNSVDNELKEINKREEKDKTYYKLMTELNEKKEEIKEEYQKVLTMRK